VRLDGPSPAAVAEGLRSEPGFVWLDGGASGHRLFRRPVAVLSARDGRAVVSSRGGRVVCRGGFSLLAAAFAAWGGDPGLVLAGFLGYELAWELETLPPPPSDDLGLPDLHLALYDEVLLWDGAGWVLRASEGLRPFSAARVLSARLVLAAAARAGDADLGRPAANPPLSRPDRAGFEGIVERAVAHIAAGDIFQVNLCRRLETALPWGGVWPLYRRLRAASPAARGAFLDLGGRRALLSVSPEVFLSVRGRRVETRPIKGTRPRGATPEEDRDLAAALLASEKDRAELTMIVDVARNDLARVCETGSVAGDPFPELTALPTLHHTVATVHGRLRPGVGSVDLLRATFPPASITGAPKIRAIGIAAGLEPRRRGPAMGALGWLDLAGDLELSVAIRTAAASRGRVAYHAGCGIVADSEPRAEWAESAVKAKAFLTALGAPPEGEA